MQKMKRTIARANVNPLALSIKINEYAQTMKLNTEQSGLCMADIILSEHIHSFPQNIPFPAAIKSCGNGQSIIFNIKRSKIAVVEDTIICGKKVVASFPSDFDFSKSKAPKEIVLGGVTYSTKDTLNDIPRYRTKLNAKTKKM